MGASATAMNGEKFRRKGLDFGFMGVMGWVEFKFVDQAKRGHSGWPRGGAARKGKRETDIRETGAKPPGPPD
jgi:hypothetical protein